MLAHPLHAPSRGRLVAAAGEALHDLGWVFANRIGEAVFLRLREEMHGGSGSEFAISISIGLRAI
jgi:hypothetical protein